MVHVIGSHDDEGYLTRISSCAFDTRSNPLTSRSVPSDFVGAQKTLNVRNKVLLDSLG